jgi:hypothetical protein
MRDLRRLPVRLINAIRASMTTVATGSAPISNLVFFYIYKYIVNQVCISHATAVLLFSTAHTMQCKSSLVSLHELLITHKPNEII